RRSTVRLAHRAARWPLMRASVLGSGPEPLRLPTHSPVLLKCLYPPSGSTAANPDSSAGTPSISTDRPAVLRASGTGADGASTAGRTRPTRLHPSGFTPSGTVA